MDRLGKRLEARRLELGLSQEKAAKRVGCALATYRGWITGGVKSPGREWYPSIAALLDISHEELLGIIGLLTEDQVDLLKASGDNPPPAGPGPRRVIKGKSNGRRSPNIRKNLSFDLVPSGSFAA